MKERGHRLLMGAIGAIGTVNLDGVGKGKEGTTDHQKALLM